MAFATNQQQNKMYTFSNMLKQNDKKDFIMAMLDKVNVYEERNYWTLIKRDDVPMNKRVNGKETLPIWVVDEAQGAALHPWWNADMGSGFLGDL
eukprot:14129559-Ditylum_brightwellii.AAC.1